MIIIVTLIREFAHNFNFVLEKYATPEDSRIISGEVKPQYIFVYALVILFSVMLFRRSKDSDEILNISDKLMKQSVYLLLFILFTNTAYFFSRFLLEDYADFIFIFLVMSELAVVINLFSRLSIPDDAESYGFSISSIY